MSLYLIERIDLQAKAEVEADTEYQACDIVGWDPKDCSISRYRPQNQPTVIPRSM